MIPHVGIAASGYRLSKATLHCAKCGQPLTDSIQDKTVEAAKAAPAKIAAAAANVNAAMQKFTTQKRCAECAAAVQPAAKFCPECGAKL